MSLRDWWSYLTLRLHNLVGLGAWESVFRDVLILVNYISAP